MVAEVDPAVAEYMERRRAEILSVIPQLEKALEKARRENKRGLIRRLTNLLVGDESWMTLREFPDHQALVISEVLWVADQLQAHGEFRPLLERVGVHGDLTESEMEALEGHVKVLLQGLRGWTEDDWNSSGPSNAWAAIALVRRVLAGVYEDLRVKKAIEFIDYNADYTGLYKHSKLFKPIDSFLPHVEEALYVVRVLASIPEAVRTMEEIIEKEAWIYLEEEYYGVIDKYLFVIFRKFGWVSKSSYLSTVATRTLHRYVDGEIDIDNDRSIVRSFHDSIRHSLHEWLMDPTGAEARLWGPSHVIHASSR